MGTAWPIEVLHSCKFATQYTAIIMQWYTMSHFDSLHINVGYGYKHPV